MKKVIRLNESQLEDLIKEIYKRTDVRRRLPANFTEKNVIERIEKEMGETDPNDYYDEYEYASNIISWVIDYFYTSSDDPMYDEIYSDIHDFMKDEYGSMIFEFYEDNVDDDKEDDDEDWDEEDDDDDN
jgi:hypothetical protein